MLLRSALRVKMLIDIVDLLPSLGSYRRLNGVQALLIIAKRWRLGMHYLVASIGPKRFVYTNMNPSDRIDVILQR